MILFAQSRTHYASQNERFEKDLVPVSLFIEPRHRPPCCDLSHVTYCVSPEIAMLSIFAICLCFAYFANCMWRPIIWRWPFVSSSSSTCLANCRQSQSEYIIYCQNDTFKPSKLNKLQIHGSYEENFIWNRKRRVQIMNI